MKVPAKLKFCLYMYVYPIIPVLGENGEVSFLKPLCAG